MQTKGAQILVVEDNPETLYGLQNNLEIEGYDVRAATTLADAREAIQRTTPDLILLDLMLPDGDGIDLLGVTKDRDCAVIILSARGDEKDKVTGLRLGADDYISKPFGVLELLARIEKQLEHRAARRLPTARIGNVDLDLVGQCALRNGKRLALTRLEVRVLCALLKRRGEVVPRVTLLRNAWRLPEDAKTRALDVCVADLRRKIEPNPCDPVWIVTVRSVGYMLTK